jgi:serine/threonine protein kinase
LREVVRFERWTSPNSAVSNGETASFALDANDKLERWVSDLSSVNEGSDGPGTERPGAAAEAGGGRYLIRALIGRGGVGSVYRAHDSARDRVVALKRLELPAAPPRAGRGASLPVRGAGTTTAHDARDSALDQVRRRARLTALFQREYHTLAQLAHPRIIEVYDYGLDAAGPFYTMELLEGRDLGSAAPLEWRRACEVLRDVASALALLHSRRLLHRDVSPRNVHATEHGPAKLIDFGAMAPIGFSELLVGTPPFVPPEAIHGQALDSRSDLYSLGALGYFLLTGRTPYRARNFGELRDAYRTPPPPLSVYAPDVPAAFDALLMRLLSMDRGGRPSSAAELVERLNGLGDLVHEPGLSVASAYLSTPTLVGRQKELVAVRRRMLRSLRGRGASVLVAGAAGVGRTRFLDACALEGKLAGAIVLRASAGAAGGVDHGVVRSLLLQLHAALGEGERRAFEPPLSLQKQLVPGLIWTRGNSKPISLRPPGPVGDPSALIETLQDYVTRLAGRRALLVLIDDFHAVDEPSAAAITGLALRAPHCRLMIVASHAEGVRAQAEYALRLLREHSRFAALSLLSARETESLLRSVFGDVPNLAQLADRLHALSEGKPRLCMELAQHLVDSGVIRSETGGFVLPEALSPGDLPESLDAALRARCDRLPARARLLGKVVALCAGAPLTIEQCVVLCDQGERSDGERALSDLLAAQMVAVTDDHVMLRQETFAPALLAQSDAAELLRLHGRIAELFAREPGLRVRAAEHYLRAGRESEALDLLGPLAEKGLLSFEWFATFNELIDTAIAACRRLGRPARDEFQLRRARTHHDLHYFEPCDPERLLAHAADLYRQSGLAHWDELGDALDPQTRLTRALQLAGEAYQRTPDHERIFAPQDAIPELARYLAAVAGHGAGTFNLDLLERLPSMAPYAVLSPAIESLEEIVHCLRDLRASRHDIYVDRVRRLLERLDEPSHGGIDEHYELIRVSVLYAIGLTDAALGHAEVFARADALERLPSMRSSAWRLRQLAHLHRGDLAQAEQCRRQFELLVIQQGSRHAHAGTTLEVESMCYAFSDDLINLRRVLPELEAMAEKHRGWRPLLLLSQGELERMRGRLPAALALYEQVLAMLVPGRHMMWVYAAAFRIRALVDLGRASDAKAFGLDVAEVCERGQMGTLSQLPLGALAQAEAALGEHHAAIARVDALIAHLERVGVSGMYAGLRYEQRARLCLLVRDAAGFEHHFARCRAHYGGALDSPFTANVVRLAADARTAGLLHDDAGLPSAVTAQVRRLRRELAACTDLHERAECALSLLVEAAGASAGRLYGMRHDGLALLACSGDASTASDDGLQTALASFVTGIAQGDEQETAIVAPGSVAALGGLGGRDGRVYYPFAIRVHGGTQISAALALAFESGPWRAPASELLVALGEELLVHGDATSVTIVR